MYCHGHGHGEMHRLKKLKISFTLYNKRMRYEIATSDSLQAL